MQTDHGSRLQEPFLYFLYFCFMRVQIRFDGRAQGVVNVLHESQTNTKMTFESVKSARHSAKLRVKITQQMVVLRAALVAAAVAVAVIAGSAWRPAAGSLRQESLFSLRATPGRPGPAALPVHRRRSPLRLLMLVLPGHLSLLLLFSDRSPPGPSLTR